MARPTPPRSQKPIDIISNGAGRVLMAGFVNHCLRRIDLATRHVTVWAGLPEQEGYQDGAALQARFSYPMALARDAAGSIFIGDYGNHCIRRVQRSPLTGELQVDTLTGHHVLTSTTRTR